MANVAFTRDEAILTLDVLLFSKDAHFSPKSEPIIELSTLLNDLPIHALEYHSGNFRNPVGISDQIHTFKRSLDPDKKSFNIGNVFFEVYEEFQDDIEQLHEIAMAIRKNKEYFCGHLFGDNLETDNFPEGALLGHLHKIVEARDSRKLNAENECCICHLNLSEIYKPVCGGLMQFHLTVPIIDLDGGKNYKQDDFITVCPTCHAILHRYRPWVTKQNYGEILR